MQPEWKVKELLQERRGYPNFDHTARVELIFACTRDISDATIVSRNGLKQNAKMQKQQYELLLQLQQLHQAGALTDEEFQKEKKRILEYWLILETTFFPYSKYWTTHSCMT